MPENPRLEKLRLLMKQHEIDLVAIIPGANLRYLTHHVHYLMERPIVLFIPQEEQPVAVIPQMEIPLFKRHPFQSQLFSWSDAEGYEDAFRQAADVLGLVGKTIGVEGLRMRFTEGEIIRRFATDAEVQAVDFLFDELRIIKTNDEIAALRQAIHISETALEKTLQSLKVGMTEIELARALEHHLRDLGAEALSFDTILHSGANSTLPHFGPLNTPIERGHPLLIDFGAVYDGYHADITRTVFVGEVKPEFREFYEVVQHANQAGRESAKPGVTAESIDLATKQVVIDAGYESLIRARTGHGLGLETHEPPYIVEGNQQILGSGMVFTIEPGIYDDGKIGVRIEDDVLITEDGCESLTTFPRDILIIGD